MGRSRGSLLADILKVAFIFLLAVVLMLAVSYLVFRTLIRGQQTEVPNVIGKDFIEASKILSQQGLDTVRIEGELYSAKLPKGYVIKQDPVPRQKVKSGRLIKVFLSMGTELEMVPRVIGQAASEVGPVLKSVGLEVGTITKIHSDQFPQEGIIIAHTPSANATVQRGDKVNLLVSLGSQSIQLMMPDLRDMELGEALELLETNGLRSGRITREASSASERDNIVLEQDPQPNERIERGTLVDIVVSSGEASEKKSRMTVLRYRVPAGTEYPETSGSRHVRIELEHEGATQTNVIVDKFYEPGTLLSYPRWITGRGVAKIYVDGIFTETMICDWPSKEFSSQ